MINFLTGISQNDFVFSKDSIYYKPIFINQCTGVSESDIEYNLEGSNYFYHYANPTSNGFIVLKDLGIYSLFKNDTLQKGNVINFTDFGVYVDTIYLDNLVISNRFVLPHYVQCGKLSEGYQTDYYSNGQLRKEGTFSSFGFLMDTLKSYYKNGGLLSTLSPPAKQFNYTEYYSNGQKSLDISQDKSERTELQFYSNGTLAWYYKKTRFKEFEVYYYESGEIKRIIDNDGEAVFYENGEIQESEFFENMFFWDNFKRKVNRDEFIYHWASYDEKGTLKRSITYYVFGRYFHSELTYDLMPFTDQIMTISFYKNGIEEIRVVQDFDNDEVSFNVLRILNDEWVVVDSFEESEFHKMVKKIEYSLK